MPDSAQISTYARLLRLTPVEGASNTPEPLIVDRATRTSQRGALLQRPGLLSCLLFITLPLCISLAYFGFWAADRYESEARFVLRMPARSFAGIQAANLLSSAGISRSNDDGYIVKEYLESRDAMALLERHANLRTAFGASNDPIWRFPNVFMPNNEEGLYRQYQRMMSTSFDNTTGVATLKMQAFSPADAQKLATILLAAAEALVNRLNERARKDAIGLAESESDRMRQRAIGAQSALTSFRERERFIDPSQETLAVLETIAKLSLESARISVQLSELGAAAPTSPQVTTLRGRRAALENQIASERKRLAGDAQSIAPRIAEYERLVLEREFAEKALVAAMTSVELARNDALRQQVYLERISMPGHPDYPTYPWRWVWCAATLVAGYMAWRMWRILSADTRRHAEL